MINTELKKSDDNNNIKNSNNNNESISNSRSNTCTEGRTTSRSYRLQSKKRSLNGRNSLSTEIRGISRKRIRSERGRMLPESPAAAVRSDDDSGLGSEAPLETNTFPGSHNQSPTSNTATSSSERPAHFTHFHSEESNKNNLVLHHQKPSLKMRHPSLDMNEEANELPDHGMVTSSDNGSVPKIISFKNIHGLVIPSTSLPHLPKNEILKVSNIYSLDLKSTDKRPNLVSDPPKSTKKKSRVHPLEGNLSSKSSDGSVELVLISQPEEQHRARYQTEGSRGAVKDRDGSGHPCVQLVGYHKSTTLQVFVASDGGIVTPHLFYQACRVMGKNSTQSSEESNEGTTLINITMSPDSHMTVNCDCVGILKERNVDVEQRLRHFVSKNKKKSSKCRLVFRTVITSSKGQQETLQVVSQPINCTQPPGLPEILRKSKAKCSIKGKEELILIGKNFSKDSKVLFQEIHQKKIVWSSEVLPEKEFLQSTHLICEIPPYGGHIKEVDVEVQIVVSSNGKISDPHSFRFTSILPNTDS